MAQFLGTAVCETLQHAKELNAMPQVNRHSQLIDTLTQFATVAASAVTLVQVYMEAVSDGRDLDLPEHVPFGAHPFRKNEGTADGRPVADPATYSIYWRGRTCFLGNTLTFRLFAQLARRPNRFYSHDELLHDVWQGPRSREAVRSVVKVLRRKLREAGMSDLAAAISGNAWNNLGLQLSYQT
jgi:hypothetical protein